MSMYRDGLPGAGRLGTFVPVQQRDAQEFYEQFAAVLRCIRAVTADAYAVFDVGTAQAKFLRHIGAHSHISQAQLARATYTAPTLTGRVLESLIEHGWVNRRRSTEDRRQYVLELTAAGKRMRERVEGALNGVVQRLTRVLDEKDADDFERIAAKILAEFASSSMGKTGTLPPLTQPPASKSPRDLGKEIS